MLGASPLERKKKNILRGLYSGALRTIDYTRIVFDNRILCEEFLKSMKGNLVNFIEYIVFN